MITFQDKIDMFRGLARYDSATGDVVPVQGDQSLIITDLTAEIFATEDVPAPQE